MNTKISSSTRQVMEETILPLSITLELERHGEGESCSRYVTVSCHHYSWTVSETSLDVFVVDAGRLRRVSSYNGVLSLIENE